MLTYFFEKKYILLWLLILGGGFMLGFNLTAGKLFKDETKAQANKKPDVDYVNTVLDKESRQKENNGEPGGWKESEAITRTKLEQLYRKSRDAHLPDRERGDAIKKYYELTERNENINCLEYTLMKKGYRNVRIDWPEGGKLKIVLDREIDIAAVEEIGDLAEKITGAGKTDIVVKTKKI